MKAKKEFFLKYIKDNEFTPQNSSKSLINNSLSLDLNNSSKSIEKNISPIKDKKSSRKCSFDKFVSEIKNYDYTTTSKWDNEARNYSINIDKNLNKIKLTELIQINYINPLLILNKEYIQEDYQSNLLESELVSIEDKIKIYKNNRKSNDKSGDKKNYDIFDNTIEFIEKMFTLPDYLQSIKESVKFKKCNEKLQKRNHIIESDLIQSESLSRSQISQSKSILATSMLDKSMNMTQSSMNDNLDDDDESEEEENEKSDGDDDKYRLYTSVERKKRSKKKINKIKFSK